MFNTGIPTKLKLLSRERWENRIREGKDPECYFIIQRKGKVGLFSYVITTMGQIEWALQHKFVPVVDMLTYPNTYLTEDCVGKYNAWEFFFDQPMGIGMKDIKSGVPCVWSGEFPLAYPTDQPECLNPTSLNCRYWQERARRYLHINADVKKAADAAYERIFCPEKGTRVLGVLCRGTDYVTLKPHLHPVQPEPSVVMEKAEELVKAGKYDKIFLATEDQKIYRAFKERFGDLVESYAENQMDYKGSDGYLANLLPHETEGKKLHGIQYLIAIELLSRCNAFIAGRTSGTVGVMLLTKGFEYQYIWDLGVYD